MNISNMSKSELEKLGSPHPQQIHEHELLASALYTMSFTRQQFVWYQRSQESHWRPFWLFLTGFWHTPQGYFHSGPGLRRMSPQCIRRFKLSTPCFDWTDEVIRVKMADRSEHNTWNKLALYKLISIRDAEILKPIDGSVDSPGNCTSVDARN